MPYKNMVFKVTSDNTILTPGVFLGDRVVALFRGAYYQVWRLPSGGTYSHQGAAWVYTPVRLCLISYERLETTDDNTKEETNFAITKVLQEVKPGRQWMNVTKKILQKAQELDDIAIGIAV